MPASPPSTKLPFWIHQALEYLCGLLIVSQAIHASSVTLPVIAGAVLILLGATADGPLAAFRLVARGLHRVLDIVAIVLLAGALALFGRDGDGAEVGLVAGAIVVLVALLFRTNYAPKPVKVKTRKPAPGASADDGGLSEEVGRKAGRAVAAGVKYVKAAKAKRDQRDQRR